MTPHTLTDAEFNVEATRWIGIWLFLMICLGIAIWRARNDDQ